MNVEIELHKQVKKELRKIDKRYLNKIKKAIVEISKNPNVDSFLKGFGKVRRRRVGDYRIAYIFRKEESVVFIVSVFPRSSTGYANLKKKNIFEDCEK